MKPHSVIATVVIALTTSIFSFAQTTATHADTRADQLSNTPPEKLVNEATYSEEWPPVAEKDLGWKRRLWKEVELRDQKNAPIGKLDAQGKNLAELLIAEAKKGGLKTYSATDDRFTKEISVEELQLILNDVSKNANTSIHKFLIKEDWLYIKGEDKLVSRIIGIAPVRETIAKDGTTSEEVLCWFYYPNIRPILRNIPVAASNANIHNADEYLETRQYTDYITANIFLRVPQDFVLPCQLTLTDTSRKIVFEQTLSRRGIQISRESISPGSYYANFRDAAGTKTQRMVVAPK